MNKKIFLILALGFLLRLSGIQFGLPSLFHADEPIVVHHALAYGSGDLNPHFFKIPPLTSYLLFFCYGIFFLAGRLTGFFHTPQDFEYFFYADPSAFYLIARIIFGAILGTLTIACFYKTLRKHFSLLHAEMAAFLFSIYFLHVRDSHYIYADIPLVFALVAGFRKIWDLLDKPSSKNVVKAAVWVGIATAFKYNGIAMALPLILALLGSRSPQLFKKLFLAGIASTAVFVLLNPYSVFDAPFFLQEIRQQGASFSGGTGWLHHLQYSLVGSAGLPFLIVTLLGILIVFRTREPKPLLLAIFGIFYYAILVFKGQHYDRYVLPLVPVCVFFASHFIVSFVSSRPAKRKILIPLFLIAVGLPSFLRCGLWIQIMSTPDVRTLAKAWVEENIPSGSKVALGWDFYMPRLSMTRDQLEEKKELLISTPAFLKSQERRLRFLIEKPTDTARYELYEMIRSSEASAPRFSFAKPTVLYELPALKQLGIQYVITGFFSSEPDPSLQSFHADLKNHAELVAEFSPYRNASLKPLDIYPLTGGPFLLTDLKSRARNGQPLQIYRLIDKTM